MHEEEDNKARPKRDRPFDPSKRPTSPEAIAVVDEAEVLLGHQEARIRRRRPKDAATYRAALEALLADAMHRGIEYPGAWITVELSKAALAPGTRRAPFMTESLADLVHYLAEADLLEVQMGYRTDFGGWRTRLRASEWLLTAVDANAIGFGDIGRDFRLQGEALILRGSETSGGPRTLPLSACEQVNQYRREMAEINEWLADAPITWSGAESVDTGRRYLRRVFNNGSLEAGGRLYHGFWQELGSAARLEHLQISDEPVVSVDFAQMAVRTAYTLVGVEPPLGDLYAHPRYPREGVKIALNAMLAASKPLTRMPAGGRHYIKRDRWDDVERAVCGVHPSLAPLFYKGVALRLMFLESQITIRALLALKGLGVYALPVHDCLLVAAPHASLASQVLLESSKAILGWEVPVVAEASSSSKDFTGPLRKWGA